VSRIQTRVTNRALELAGIQRADQGPRISDNIQLIYGFGDLGFLLAPVPGADGFRRAQRGPIAAVFGGVEVHANVDSGIEITHIEELGGVSDIQWNVGTTALDANLTAGGADFSTPNGSSRISVVTGTIVANPGNQITLPNGTALQQAALPIKVFPGEWLFVSQSTANTLFQANIFWRETPTVAATL